MENRPIALYRPIYAIADLSNSPIDTALCYLYSDLRAHPCNIMDPFVAQFHGFVADLTTVEKRSIVALTEFARDALRTNLYAVPSLAAVIINRISQVKISKNMQ